MCRVLEVSPSGYYASLKRPASWHAQIDEVLLAHVRNIYRDSGETYGAPRVHRELQALGLPTSRKRTARLMRTDGLAPRPRKRRRISTTHSNHDEPIAPNLVAREFDVNGVAINRVWVADMTHIPTREGPLYLATVLDLGSRRCVGWAMRDTMDVALPLSALRMAYETRRPTRGLIHHSDRGSQGEFNRSSQHLLSEVWYEQDGTAKVESFNTREAAIPWTPAGPGAVRAASLLGSDRARPRQRGRGARGRRVGACRDPVVSPLWWDASLPSAHVRAAAIGALPVPVRAGDARASACTRPRGSCNRRPARAISFHNLPGVAAQCGDARW
jgi:putative transposase